MRLSKLAIALRAAFVPVLLAFSVLATGCEGQIDIVHGLEEVEANEILVVLNAQGMTGAKLKEEGRVVTYAILVAESEAPDALQLLVDNKLPRARPQGLAQVYPAGSGGLIPTESEEKAKFLMALHGEIERKLLQISGIVRAHVTVVIPEKDVIRDLDTPPPPATASVAVAYNAIDGDGTAPTDEDKLQRLVASAIEDLKPENVTIIMTENRPLRIVQREAETAEDGAPAGPQGKVFGVAVASKKAATAAKVRFGMLGGLALLGLALGVGAVVYALRLRSQLGKANAQVSALKKSGELT